MAEVYTPMTFSVRALDVSVNAILATVSGIPEETFDSDVTAAFSLDVNDAKNMFHFQSDAVDVDDVVANDLRYKLIYTDPAKEADGVTPDNTWVLDHFIQNTICDGTDTDPADHVYTVGTSGATNKAVTYDYVRFLAYKLFNTHLGVDLFDNETEVREALNNNARENLSNLLLAINDHQSNEWLDASACTDETPSTGFKAIYGANHPTYVIVQNLINSHPERFHDLSNNYISGDQSGVNELSEFSVPFVAGDIIQFQLTVKAHADQTDVLTGVSAMPTINDRTYRIRIELV
jgi:hypothetical protein